MNLPLAGDESRDLGYGRPTNALMYYPVNHATVIEPVYMQTGFCPNTKPAISQILKERKLKGIHLDVWNYWQDW